ncbi:hypothetical protein [Pseudomonas fluorescens]|nr:hypothetical protein [Pseudomonas fluorescens]
MSTMFKEESNLFETKPTTHVSGEIIADVSNRGKLATHNIQFQEDDNSENVAVIARSYENGFGNSKKGMAFVFNKNIKAGSYKANDPNFPFAKLYYFESFSNEDRSNAYQYKPADGQINVVVIEATPQALRYVFTFNFNTQDYAGKKMNIAGKLELNVLRSE